MTRQTLIILTIATTFMCCNNQTTDSASNDPNACIIDTITTVNIENPVDTILTSKLHGKWKLALVWKKENNKWLGLHYHNFSEEFNFDRICEHRFYDKNGKMTDSLFTDYFVQPADSTSITFIALFRDTLESKRKHKHGDLIYTSGRIVHLLTDTILRLSNVNIFKQKDNEKQISEFRRIKLIPALNRRQPHS